MKLTKDEARILAAAISDYRFSLCAKRDMPGLFDSLTKLTNKLSAYSKDKRRSGRKSMNDFSDCLKRFTNKK